MSMRCSPFFTDTLGLCGEATMTDGTDRGHLANRRTRVGVREDGASTTLVTIDRAGCESLLPGDSGHIKSTA